MHPFPILRSAQTKQITVGESLEDAEPIGFEHFGGLTVFAGEESQLDEITIHAAPTIGGDYLPVVTLPVETPAAIPVTDVFPCAFLKITGNATERVDVTLKS